MIERLSWYAFREWLAFKIFPEMDDYIELSGILSRSRENRRVAKVIKDSSLRNKKAVLDLIEDKYFTLNDIIEKPNDASEDQTS